MCVTLWQELHKIEEMHNFVARGAQSLEIHKIVILALQKLGE